MITNRHSFTLALSLILLTGLAAENCQAQQYYVRLYVLGDSLSAGDVPGAVGSSWADLIDAHGFAHVRNLAIGGTRLDEVDIPPRLACDWVHAPDTRVILWAGSNDYFQGAALEDTAEALHDRIAQVLAQGCELWVFLPPLLVDLHPLLVPEGRRDTVALRDMFSVVLQDYPGVRVVDFRPDCEGAPQCVDFWQHWTLDGVHQAPGMHWWQAAQIIRLMGLDS